MFGRNPLPPSPSTWTPTARRGRGGRLRAGAGGRRGLLPGRARREGDGAPAAPGGNSESPAPSGAAFTAGYANVELTSPEPAYEFDLKAGKVVPADTATWYLARTRTEFVAPEDSDAFIAAGDELSPAECVRGSRRNRWPRSRSAA